MAGYRGRSLLTIVVAIILLLLISISFLDGNLSGGCSFIPPSSDSSDSSSSDEHLKGEAKLERIFLTGNRLQMNTMVGFTDDSVVDFTNPTDENLFGLYDGELIVPGNKYEATMRLTNTGDITLDYWMEVRMIGDEYLELADQLKVTLKVDETVVSAPVSVGVPLGDERRPVGKVLVNQSITFTVTVEFVDHVDNNLAQGQRVEFDLFVFTVEGV